MRMKRLLSLVISTAMLLSAFSGLTMTSASAEVGDLENNIWTASAEDADKPAESVLYDGEKGTLTTMFDLTLSTETTDSSNVTSPVNETVGDRTFSAFVSHPSMNGGWSDKNGTTDPGKLTMFKFVPKEDGVVTAFLLNVGTNKGACILKDGTTNFKNPGTDGGSIVYTMGTGSMSISAELEANQTYYIFVDGSKGRFAAIDYEVGATYEQATPPPAPTVDPNSKSWSASELDFGRTAGDLLMGGLTLVSDNSSTNKAYISAADNGKIETTEDGKAFSGSALKFVAPSDGQLEVTMIDLGEATVNEETGEVTTTKSVTPVIYGISEKGNVFEYTTSGHKETVVCTADVTEGNTYYITATGTRGRFSAAKFTPASEIPEETPTPPEEPVTNGISYKDGTVTVNLEDTSVTTGVLIVASYEGNALSDVKTETLTFTDGTATKEITVENGAKLMVWDSLEGMKPLCGSLTVKEEQPATPVPSEQPTDFVIWRADDSAFAATLNQTGATVNGLTVPSGLSDKGKKVVYTHVDGTEYTFTSQWSNFGSNTEFSFTPEQACIVYVVFNGNGSAGKSIEIKQGEKLLGSHTAEIENNAAAEVAVADVDDPTAGDVIIKGTGGNKNVAAIIVEYYDPTVIINQTLSGKITYTGTLGLTDKTLVFKNTRTGAEFEMQYTSEDYSIELPQKSTYTIYVKDNEDNICATLDTREVYLGKEAKAHNISIADIVDDAVTGEVVTHGLDLSDVTLTFTAKDDPTITANAVFSDIGEDKTIETATNKLAVTLTPNHEYTITASGIDGYTLSPLSSSYLMKAGDTAPFKNILFTKNVAPIAYKSTVTVGADKDYKTIQEALNAVQTMTGRPVGSAGRVEIAIDTGTYVEQLQVNAPYVTLKAADPENRPKITFYYGVGYLYYSADSGFYSEDKYVQQTELGTVNSWGTTVNVNAQNFLAENIIFENSFSCRVTPEELKDGVTAAGPGKYGDVSNKPDRTVANYDAMTKNAVERAAAICLRGANFEIYNCDFISSQDTFYTSANGYVKNSYIEGGTDYIYGGNSVVFEDCTLAWHGYSDQSVGGYITAGQTSASPKVELNVNSNGYLLKDCTVTNSKYYPNNKFAAGSWGRNWGGEKCRTIFLNTTMDGADVPGAWVRMAKNSDGTLAELSISTLYVHGVTDKNGAAVDVSSTTFNPNGQMTAEEIAAINPVSYFNEWTPVHYTGEIPEKTTYTTTWYFGKSNGAPVYNATEGSEPITITGDTDSPTPVALTVDPTAKGKFTNSSRPDTDKWAQVNAETIFTLPVVNGSKIMIDSNGGEVLTAPNGTTVTRNEPYTYIGEGGNVNFTVTSGGYIASIKVVSPINPEEYVPVLNAVTVADAANGTVTTSATDGTAEQGSVVTITATPNTGYKVGEITVTKASGGNVEVKDSKFTMPAEAVTVTVTFAEKPSEQPSRIDYEMPFSNNNGVIDGVTISSQQDYKLFDDFVTLKNMKYDNNHGAQGNGPIEVQVPGPVEITVGACAFNDCKVVVTDSAGNKVAEQDDFIGDQQYDASNNKGTYSCYGYNNGSVTLNYNGAATKLTISFEKSTNGKESGARFWLPYLRVKSVEAVTPTTAPTTEPTTAPTTSPTPAPTTEPTPTQDPAPASKWTAKAATGYTATVDDGADVLTAAAGSTGSGFVYDLTQIEGFALPASYATANGTLTVSFDMLVSSTAAPNDNYFVMLSTDNTNNRAWSAGSNKELGGFAGYADWGKVQFLGSNVSTAASEPDTVQDANALAKDAYKTITYTIDFSAENKIFKATYDGTEYAPTTNLSNLENGKLYLNTTFGAGASDAVLKIKNITASYTAGGTVTPTEPPTPSDEDVTVSGTIGITGKYKNTGNKLDSYMLVPADLTLTFTEGETVKTATITGEEAADGSGLAYTATLDPSKTYNIKLMDTNGNTYALDAASVTTTTEATATQNLTATKKYAYPVTIQYDENSYNALMSDSTITDDTEFSIRFNEVSINGDSSNKFTPPVLKFKRTDVDAETRTVTVTGYDLPAFDTTGEHDAYTKAWFEDSKIPNAVILNTGADQIGLSSGLPVIVFRNTPNFSVTLASAPASVVINGTKQVNNTLTTEVAPDNAAVTYQWYTAEAADAEESAWTAIDGATASSLTLTAAQQGKYIAVKVTGTGIAGTASAITESAVEASNITSYTYTFAVDQAATSAPSYNTNTNLLSSSDNNVDKAISMILVAKDKDDGTATTSCAAQGVKISNDTYKTWRIATRGNGNFQSLSDTVNTGADGFTWGSYSNAVGNPLIVVTPKVKGTFSITIGHRVSNSSTFYIWDNEKGKMQTDSGQAEIKTLTLTLEAGHTYVMGHVGTGDGAVYAASFTTLENLPE